MQNGLEKMSDPENEKRFASIGKITGIVAHDLNNIFTGIGTYPEVLMMDKALDPKIVQGLEMIRDSGQSASAVIRDLLTICQGVTAEKERMDINTVLDNYIEANDFKKIKQEYDDIKIKIEKASGVLNIKGSYLHIEKIIMNLFLYAAQEVAQKPNGNINIKTAVKILLDSSVHRYGHLPPGEYVVLNLSYNGSMLSENSILGEKDKTVLFEPFFITKNMGRKGSGLGLTLIWSAVQDHNGYIDLEYDENETRFEILFPADRD